MKLAVLAPRVSGLAHAFPSGGDLYDRELALALERRGHAVDVFRTPRAFSAAAWSKRLCAGEYAAVLQDELGHADYVRLNRALAGRIASFALVHVTRARLEPAARSAALERAFLGSVDGALFVSRQVRRETERLLDVRVPSRVAYPGCDHLPRRADRSRGLRVPPSAAKPVRFVCAGHLLPHKGQLELIEAFAGVRAAYVLALAGDAERDRRYAARVLRAARQLGPGKVQLLGPLAPVRLQAALARADVFASASFYESYGIAAAEALDSGLPVVAWSEGGLWEFLEPNLNALRVRPGDRTGLTRALASLCDDPKLLRRLQRGARVTRRALPCWDDTAVQLERLVVRLERRAQSGDRVRRLKARRDAA